MRFEFATASRILFGPGVLREAGAAARQFGRHAFVVTGRAPRRAEPLLDGWKTWLSANNATVMIVLFLVFGVVLIGKGIGGL